MSSRRGRKRERGRAGGLAAGRKENIRVEPRSLLLFLVLCWQRKRRKKGERDDLVVPNYASGSTKGKK
jgi:hypothetical protein